MLNLPRPPVPENDVPLPAEQANLGSGFSGLMGQIKMLSDLMSRPEVEITQANPLGGIVVGPGKAAMKNMIPPKLYEYLHRAPQRFITSVENEMPSVNAAGAYLMENPKHDSGVLGRILISKDYVDDPGTWTHESMHAANDLTRLRRGVRETAKAGQEWPIEKITTKHTPKYERGFVMDTGDQRQSRSHYNELLRNPYLHPRAAGPRWTTPTDEAFLAAMRKPGMMQFHENYAEQYPNIDPKHLQLESINEWQTRNALEKLARTGWKPTRNSIDAEYMPATESTTSSAFEKFIQMLTGR